MFLHVLGDYETLLFFASVTVVVNLVVMYAIERRYRLLYKQQRLPVHIERELNAVLSSTAPGIANTLPHIPREDPNVFVIEETKTYDHASAQKLKSQLVFARELVESLKQTLEHYAQECETVSLYIGI
jgi:hypothetical protein